MSYFYSSFENHSAESYEKDFPLNPTLNDFESQRQRYIYEIADIERDIDENLSERDYSDVREELHKFEHRVWPRVVELNERILKEKSADPSAAEAERKLQAGLKQTADRIRSKAGRHG